MKRIKTNEDSFHRGTSIAVDENGVYHTPISFKKLVTPVDIKCPSCLNELIPRVNGKQNAPHFAHKSNNVCNGETSYHRIAKEMIKQNLNLITFTNKCKICNCTRTKKFNDGEISHLEQLINPYRIDVGVNNPQTNEICGAIEILHTHKIDDIKSKNIQSSIGNVFEVKTDVILRGDLHLFSELTCLKCLPGLKPKCIEKPVINNTTNTLENDEAVRKKFLALKIKPGKVDVLQGTAGSGKTTLLEGLVNRNKDQHILYMCYNKELSEDASKRFEKYPNVDVCTIDSIWYRLFDTHVNSLKTKKLLNDCNLKYKVYFTDVLRGKISVSEIKDEKVKIYITEKLKDDSWWHFDLLPKKLHDEYNDVVSEYFNQFHLVIIDEAQDMKPMTSKIISTIVHKVSHVIYAGDPDQQLYKFSGAINSMENTGASENDIHTLERTFRFGMDICDFINIAGVNRYKTTSGKSVPNTPIILDSEFIFEKNISYTYIFRSVRQMVMTAERFAKKGIRVKINFSKRIAKLRKEKKLVDKSISVDDQNFNWLKSLSDEEIDNLKILFEKSDSGTGHIVTFDTVHGMKGREEDVVRVAKEIISEEDRNIRNVALTRSRKLLVLDS